MADPAVITLRTAQPSAAPSGAAPSSVVLPAAVATRPELVDPERPVGDLLVAEGVLAADQLAKALRVQARLEEWHPLGAVLVELGLVARARVDEAIKAGRRLLSIEQILVSHGVLRAEQLAAATDALKDKPGADPVRHLVEVGVLSERAFLEAYCEKHNLPYVDVDINLVDRSLLGKVNLKYLTKNRLLPMSVQKGRLNLAMDVAPADQMLEEFERHFGLPVSVWISEPSKVTGTLHALEQEATNKPSTPVKTLQYRVSTPVGDDNRTVSEIVDQILQRAISQRASDIHLDPDKTRLRVRFRIDGELVRAVEYPVAQAPAVISRLKVLAEADIAERRIHQQGRITLQYEGGDIDVRASFYVTVYGENAVLRLLRKSALRVGLEELGLSPPALRIFTSDVLELSSGMLLVTGPTGSGKTTTLYAAVQRLVDDTRKVITCEDPIEYLVEGVTQCSVAERPGITFVDSLRTILRQDPDVILIGEIRDRESAGMAVECALTGHKVLSTLHTEESVSAITRLLQMGIEPFLVSSTMSAVLAQRLLRRPCAQCRADHTPTAAEMRSLSLRPEDLATARFTRSRGCPNCQYTGYRGRVGVYELLLMSDALRDAILEKRPPHEIRRIAQESPGFYSLQEDGLAKALHGQTTLSEVIANCPRCPSNRRLRQLSEIYT
jgi:type IV pilus assembly protein PilB